MRRNIKYSYDKSRITLVFEKGIPSCCQYLKSCFSSLLQEITFMSNSPQVGSSEAPETPAPGTSTPTPQQNQGVKPASKPGEQQK
jgi:hypothetical protein